MADLYLIPREEFDRLREAAVPEGEMLPVFADMCRANALMAVKKAGSGHLGSSFSAMDIVVHLYLRVMNTLRLGIDHPDRDVYFSSKGHDCPGHYALLYALGILGEEKLLRLRRLGGLDGHPDVGVPGVESNSGSLGMGVSKGRGMAWAKGRPGRGGRVYVLLGDGELQEGQNYEALQATAHQRVGNLTVLVDHNKVQSDRPVSEIVDLGDLESKLRVFGWETARCDGHDHEALSRVLAPRGGGGGRPLVIIADTVKGRGVSFMEHPAALRAGGGYYRWHAGAPPDDSYVEAYGEITGRVEASFLRWGLGGLERRAVEAEAARGTVYSLKGEPVSAGGDAKPVAAGRVTEEYVAAAYGDALAAIGRRRPDLVVLDADLSADCRTRPFELAFPDRFIENGIAEQDMVSMAGGLASQGLLPVVNSFASFLASRANEQIYNNATEQTKIIYACHYAGLIPAGPGKSHQSLRDISLLGALPNCVIVQPCNTEETREVLEYAVERAVENVAIRLVIGPSPRRIALPEGWVLEPGRGTVLRRGRDAIIFAYGPVMLHEALLASELLEAEHVGLEVVNMPWLNRVDRPWLSGTAGPFGRIFVLEDHSPVGGLGDFLLNVMTGEGLLRERRFHKFAVEGYPACGTPPEALRAHGLDGASLAEAVLRSIQGPRC